MTTTSVQVSTDAGVTVEAYIRPQRAKASGSEVANVTATADSSGLATLALRHTSEITPTPNHWLIVVRESPIVTHTIKVDANTLRVESGRFDLKLEDANSYIIGDLIFDVVYRGEQNLQ